MQEEKEEINILADRFSDLIRFGVRYYPQNLQQNAYTKSDFYACNIR